MQVKRDWLPELAKTNTKCLTVGMRSMEKAKDFVDRMDFPADKMLVDLDMSLYQSVGMYENVNGPQYVASMAKQVLRRGLKGDMGKVFKGGYKPFVPSGIPEAVAQGGCLVFRGNDLILEHYDEGPGDHVDMDTVLKVLRG